MTAILPSVFKKKKIKKKNEPSKKNVITPCKVFWNSIDTILSWKHHHHNCHLLAPLALPACYYPFHNVFLEHGTSPKGWTYAKCPIKPCAFCCGMDRVADWSQGLVRDVIHARKYHLQPIWPSVFPLPATVQAKGFTILNFAEVRPPKMLALSLFTCQNNPP